jgi:hypothetical protein
VDLDMVEVRADGSTARVPHVPAADPGVDCFYVYPTVDLRLLGAGLHDDLGDHADVDRTVGIQAARLSSVCRVYAPLYRQVTLGTYSVPDRNQSVANQCYDVAYADVLAAFEHYLAHDNAGRGFVLVSHSQGSQITSRLLRERVEPDAALHDRLVVAAPIGWAVGVGGPTGGSFPGTPTCTSDEQLGCVVAYRTYAEGNDFPDENPTLREGGTSICVHPGDVAGGGPAPLHGSIFPADLDGAQFPDGVRDAARWVLYRDLYEAECVANGEQIALRVRVREGDPRASPVDLHTGLVSGALGTHVYDFQLAEGDLVALIGTKIAAYEAR